MSEEEAEAVTTESDSEDEGPEEISFKNSKTLVEEEASLVKLQKLNEKLVLKLKRKMRHELNRAQKLEKKQRLEAVDAEEPLFPPELLDKLREESGILAVAPPDSEATAADTNIASPQKLKTTATKKSASKTYSDLNIQVRTISSIPNSRASAANSFRAQRLAKPHREMAGNNVESYREKLRASGRLRN